MCSDLVLQSSQVSLQPLMFAQQSLDTGQVAAEVVGRHQLLLLFDPADGLVHVPEKKPVSDNSSHVIETIWDINYSKLACDTHFNSFDNRC